ncbi:MAG: hypothetical protein ACREUU_20145, partial [Gammaproteobacteria bacterium]
EKESSTPAAEAGAITPQAAAQTFQTLVQAGFFPSPPLNPDVVRHMTDFLSHDSDNRLSWLDREGGRKFKFRMAGLILGAIFFFGLLVLPMVALWKGDMAFVNAFLDRHMPYLIALIAALIGGLGLKELFK